MTIHVKDIGKDPIFILGVERCGSTWLANIFDSNPDILFYMEPFANFAEIFKGFPERQIYLSNNVDENVTIMETGFKRLYQLKYPFWQNHYSSDFTKYTSELWLSILDKTFGRLSAKSKLKSVQFNLLNLNRKEENRFVKKNISASRTAVKELRLNFKIAAINSLYPEAKYIVVLRNPISQLNSISGLFEKGSLYQLKDSLDNLFEDLNRNVRFEKYKVVLSNLDQKSIFHLLVAYWFINYNTLIEDLVALNIKHRVVSHEDLSDDTLSVATDLFDYCGLELGSSVRSYIEKSTSGSNNISSPVDTNRKSKTYHSDVLNAIGIGFKEEFSKVAEPFWNLSVPEVRSFQKPQGY